jgi:hypothetical protein
MDSLFAGYPDGAHILATIKTMIQTANLWDLDLYRYVTYLLEEMTNVRTLKANLVNYSRFLPFSTRWDILLSGNPSSRGKRSGWLWPTNIFARHP